MTDNTGLKVGAGYCAIGAASAYSLKSLSSKAILKTIKFVRASNAPKDAYEITKPLFENGKLLKSTNLMKPLLKSIPVYLGCGAIVDWANRKQRENNEPNAVTKNGNEYTKVNMGKKLGAILGAVSYGVLALMSKGQMAKFLSKSPNKLVTIGYSVATSMLGGYILGAITDSKSNKKAAKEADKVMA